MRLLAIMYAAGVVSESGQNEGSLVTPSSHLVITYLISLDNCCNCASISSFFCTPSLARPYFESSYPSTKGKGYQPSYSTMLPACLLSLIFLLLTCGLAVQTYPATVEFDVVFPRNDTYAPVHYLPVIFAIQNPQAAVPLTLGIEWYLWRAGSGDWLANGIVDLSQANFSTDPYFVVLSTNQLNGTEGTFGLIWVLHSGNCSTNPLVNPQLGSSVNYNNIKFTTKNGAQQPSLVSSPDTCPTQNVTFNVTGTLQVTDSIDYGSSACAVVREPPPLANPCAIKIDDTMASSMSAIITCATPLPNLASSCPAPINSSGQVVRPNSGGIGLTVVTIGSWLSLLFWGLQ
jgi:hypothetical protein